MASVDSFVSIAPHRPCSIDELTEIARSAFESDKLEISKLRPFFWTMVEAYVDRFQEYPFDVQRVLFSWLETREYPEHEVSSLIEGIERQYEMQHGRPLRAHPRQTGRLDDEIETLRATLRYAALVGENHDR